MDSLKRFIKEVNTKESSEEITVLYGSVLVRGTLKFTRNPQETNSFVLHDALIYSVTDTNGNGYEVAQWECNLDTVSGFKIGGIYRGNPA